MSLCPACGHDNRPGAKFCSECGVAVVDTAHAPREERKVVTVLFADLVGFTSRAEQLDPEDVRALLSPYYVRLRTELERFGGTVEKFIGDAVMALFGAPTAHEDDPERALRAALAIRDWVLEQQVDLQLRIAVNTGEALVALTANPVTGEGMAAGDVVNTTARLQAAAPVNGILVGEATYRATAHAITYRAQQPVAAKGKAELVPVWEAIEVRPRFGIDLASPGSSPMIGRDQELNVLTDSLTRVRRDQTTHLVTIVGIPGIGKSRIVAELFRAVDEDRSSIVLWRQGRSLPYGDGVTFWALAEMVKAQAGILDSDSPERATEKLQVAVATVIPAEADAQWITGQLRPLVGAGAGTELGGDRRNEAFTAWRRFFEALAEQNPLVLVFEDLHWADSDLLDFIEYLVDWARGVPMLVVCTARPELFERRSGWGGGTRNATTLSLSPLSDEETAQLIGSLSEQSTISPDTRRGLLARAGGNPLYAVQYVRMLSERGEAEELPLPETVQGIIAARLDALPTEEKWILQNAAVMGKVFWLGAVSQIGELDRRKAELLLHALERKDFVLRARRSSVADEEEYAFLHLLVRDVAYGQVPRSGRAEKHLLAAEWIASLGRTEDNAEMLAHHYLSALELRRATGQPLDPHFAERALASVRESGDRAFSLNAYAGAARFYESALGLAPAGSAERAQLLFRLGRTRYPMGDFDPALLSAAGDALLACGDRETAAEAEALLAELAWERGDRDATLEHLARAREQVEGRATSRAKAFVFRGVSRLLMVAEENDEAIRLGREAMAMAEELGLDEVRASALNSIGSARVRGGDPAGMADLEASLVIAERANAAAEICRAYGNLGATLWERGQLASAYWRLEQAADAAARFGQIGFGYWFRAQRVVEQHVLGRWQEALAGANAFLSEVEGGSPHYFAAECYVTRAQIRLGRDDVRGAAADAERALELARLARDPQSVFPSLARAANVFHETGDLQRAGALVEKLVAQVRAGRGLGSVSKVSHVCAWTLSALGGGQALLDVLPSEDVPWAQAARSFVSGDLAGAADVCAGMGALTEEARDRLWLAESLVRQNRRAEADLQLQKALAFYRSVGATRYIREAESLLAASA